MRLGAGTFVGGETLDEGVVVLRGLNELGMHANTTLLGERVNDAAEAVPAPRVRGDVGRLVDEQLQINVALKLTHLGLELDEELAYGNIERLVAPERRGSFIRIDMEDSPRGCDAADLPPSARGGPRHVGTVLQAYLFRTAQASRRSYRSSRTSGS